MGPDAVRKIRYALTFAAIVAAYLAGGWLRGCGIQASENTTQVNR